MSSKNNYIIFNHSGRFGNAVFRYMAYTMLQKNIENGNIDCNNNASKFTYIYLKYLQIVPYKLSSYFLDRSPLYNLILWFQY